MIKEFRKKPVIVEAIQVKDDADTTIAIQNWVDETISIDYSVTPPVFKIHTLEGIMQADLDDWIIKGVKGEFYPCKPDIFEATYEEFIR